MTSVYCYHVLNDWIDSIAVIYIGVVIAGVCCKQKIQTKTWIPEFETLNLGFNHLDPNLDLVKTQVQISANHMVHSHNNQRTSLRDPANKMTDMFRSLY